MKVGDLVTWHSQFFGHASSDYASPGVIIKDCGLSLSWGETRRYLILWADGKRTTEHSGYLRVISEALKKS